MNKLKKVFELIKIKRKEKIFNFNNIKIKYLFFEEKKSNELIIVFSAFPKKGRPASYNYVNALKSCNVNKLYILDNYGPDIRGGSYYIGQNRDNKIKEATLKLISSIMQQYHISKDNVSSVGSSKGGFAALLFGLELNLNRCIVGAPQTLLGNYLREYNKNLEYIAGDNSEESVQYLNKILYEKSLYEHKTTNIFFHVSKCEHHYQDHTLPYINFLNSIDYNINLDLGEYKSHAEVGNYFIEYMKKIIC